MRCFGFPSGEAVGTLLLSLLCSLAKVAALRRVVTPKKCFFAVVAPITTAHPKVSCINAPPLRLCHETPHGRGWLCLFGSSLMESRLRTRILITDKPALEYHVSFILILTTAVNSAPCRLEPVQWQVKVTG